MVPTGDVVEILLVFSVHPPRRSPKTAALARCVVIRVGIAAAAALSEVAVDGADPVHR
jgi:hypothetical protein